jgi:hypothetical protein
VIAGLTKLAVHVFCASPIRLCQASIDPHLNDQIKLTTLVGLHLLAVRKAYNNIFLGHHVFYILQVTAVW